MPESGIYNQMSLRRDVVAHLVKHWDLLKEHAMEIVRNLYTRVDSDIKLSNVKQWCHSVLTDGFWLDSLFIQLVASMWGISISLLRSDNLHTMKFRHSFESLSNPHLLLIYNCDPDKGHYSGALEVDKEGNTYQLHTKLVFCEGYDPKLDIRERFEVNEQLWEFGEGEDGDELEGYVVELKQRVCQAGGGKNVLYIVLYS